VDRLSPSAVGDETETRRQYQWEALETACEGKGISTQLVMLVGWANLSRWRCQFEVHERDSHEEEGEECDRRAEGASVVDNGNKAAVPLGSSGSSMRRNITYIGPAGDASVIDNLPELYVFDVSLRAVGFAGPLRSCISAKLGRFPLLVDGDAFPLLTS